MTQFTKAEQRTRGGFFRSRLNSRPTTSDSTIKKAERGRMKVYQILDGVTKTSTYTAPLNSPYVSSKGFDPTTSRGH